MFLFLIKNFKDAVFPQLFRSSANTQLFRSSAETQVLCRLADTQLLCSFYAALKIRSFSVAFTQTCIKATEMQVFRSLYASCAQKPEVLAPTDKLNYFCNTLHKSCRKAGFSAAFPHLCVKASQKPAFPQPCVSFYAAFTQVPIPPAFAKLLRSFFPQLLSCAKAAEKLVFFRKGMINLPGFFCSLFRKSKY